MWQMKLIWTDIFIKRRKVRKEWRMRGGKGRKEEREGGQEGRNGKMREAREGLLKTYNEEATLKEQLEAGGNSIK